MTPLAHRVARDLTLPLKRRTFNDHADVLRRMSDLHCFEVTAGAQMIDAMSLHVKAGDTLDQRSQFLPAPRTWIEMEVADTRIAWLLEEQAADKTLISVASILGNLAGMFGATSLGLMRLGAPEQPHFRDGIVAESWIVLPGMLALINTPKIIGRRQHMPHRGLERKLTAAFKPMGHFPLHAWTEIRLEISAPFDENGNECEAHLTGQRALHFCRAHLRIRFGKVEIVRSHWRGDASLGIKQSRYRLIQPNRERTMVVLGDELHTIPFGAK